MEEVLLAVIAGDTAAWRRLWLALMPLLQKIAKSRRLTGRLCERDEERDNIADAVMERLRADDFRRIRAFLVSHRRPAGSSFETWVAAIATRTAIDYRRTHPEYNRTSETDAGEIRTSGPRWVRFEPVPDSSSAPATAGVDATRLATAQQILERAAHILTSEQREAFALWLVDEDYDEIARKLGLAGAPTAHKLVRAATERLRARYNPGEDR